MKQVSNAIKSFSLCRFVFLLGITAMLAAGCHKENDYAKKTVTLNAEFVTVSTVLQAGPPEHDSIAGQGSGTPIGESSFIAHAQFDTSYNLTGHIVCTTANGDKFFANITGHAPDINKAGAITLHFDATITGGTGKYARATGSFAGIAHESIYNSAGSASWDGTITY